MPGGDGTGPVGGGPRDGRGRRFAGRGQSSARRGAGAMTGGRKGRGAQGKTQNQGNMGRSFLNTIRNFFQQSGSRGRS
jgi:hypothetical protein